MVKNVDLWKWLDDVIKLYKVNWYWVKGYSGYLENECCDELVCVGVNNLIYEDIGY